MSYPEITFKDFQSLMAQRKRSVDDLVDLFRGKIEDPREFFERVISCRYHHEARSGVVIPYRSVIEFYQQELGYWNAGQAEKAAQAEKRKRPISEERKQALREHLARVRDRRKLATSTREIIEEVI